jgi:hypothetical protein
MIALYLALAFILGGMVSAYLLLIWLLRDAATERRARVRNEESRPTTR